MKNNVGVWSEVKEAHARKSLRTTGLKGEQQKQLGAAAPRPSMRQIRIILKWESCKATLVHSSWN